MIGRHYAENSVTIALIVVTNNKYQANNFVALRLSDLASESCHCKPIANLVASFNRPGELPLCARKWFVS